MTTHPAPRISRAPAFSLIWIVPLLAVGIGAWMVISEFHSRGPEITIEFKDVSGVESGRTNVEYNGVIAGSVTAVALKKDLSGAVVTVRLKKVASPLAAQGSEWWIVHPEFGFQGVHGLDTLVSGVRLSVKPGHGPEVKNFIGLEKTPPPQVEDNGKTFIIQSDKLDSLTTGSPVLYRQFKVGEVVASRLSDDSTSVLIRIHIDPPYKALVRTSSKFWNAGGFSFKVSLLGAQLKDSSLESLVSGGIAFATPDQGELAPEAADGDQYWLNAEPQKEWLEWLPKVPIQSPEATPSAPQKEGLLPSLLKR